jgi:hypothetical protein
MEANVINMNGSLILNGLTDKDLVKLLDIKIRHEKSLNFNPQQMQLTNMQTQTGQQQVYNNVVLGWSNEQGLEGVQEIVRTLLKKEETAKAVGQ